MKKETNCRLGRTGGQAVIDGVMMKSPTHVGIAVRMADGSIKTEDNTYVPLKDKHKILGAPLIRGFANFIESLIFSFSTLDRATRMLGIEEEEGKFEKWLKKKFGKSIMDVIMPLAAVLGVALALVLFVYLPILATTGIEALVKVCGGDALGDIWKTVIEGVLKVVIFLAYLELVSLMKEIKTTFRYHGAEHKTIFCYEKNLELTVENVRKQRRFHPRCGTSFLFLMIAVSIIIMILLNLLFLQADISLWSNRGVRFLVKIIALPIIVSIGYEFLRFAGRHPGNVFVKIFSAPGLWIQRITTKEPDDGQIEVGIAALKASLPDEFPPEMKSEATTETTEAASETTSETTSEITTVSTDTAEPLDSVKTTYVSASTDTVENKNAE